MKRLSEKRLYERAFTIHADLRCDLWMLDNFCHPEQIYNRLKQIRIKTKRMHNLFAILNNKL